MKVICRFCFPLLSPLVPTLCYICLKFLFDILSVYFASIEGITLIFYSDHAGKCKKEDPLGLLVYFRKKESKEFWKIKMAC